jgi:hypothetical protein
MELQYMPEAQSFHFPTDNNDINFLILQTLDDNSLLSTCSSNKYLSELGRDEDRLAWRQRFINRYGVDLDGYLDPDDSYKKAYLKLSGDIKFCKFIFISLRYGYYPLLEKYKDYLLTVACDEYMMTEPAFKSNKLQSVKFAVEIIRELIHNDHLSLFIARYGDCDLIVMAIEKSGGLTSYVGAVGELTSNDTLLCVIQNFIDDGSYLAFTLVSKIKLKNRGVEFLNQVLSIFPQDMLQSEFPSFALVLGNKEYLSEIVSIYMDFNIFKPLLDYVTSIIQNDIELLAFVIDYAISHDLPVDYSWHPLNILGIGDHTVQFAYIDLLPSDYFNDPEILEIATIPTLKRIVKNEGEKYTGTKSELIRRILNTNKDK